VVVWLLQANISAVVLGYQMNYSRGNLALKSAVRLVWLLSMIALQTWGLAREI
jgi:hypothetical protein